MVDVQNWTGLVERLRIIRETEVAGGFVGITVAHHVESIAREALAQRFEDLIPGPNRRTRRVQQYDRISGAPFYEEHISSRSWNSIGKITAYKHKILCQSQLGVVDYYLSGPKPPLEQGR